MIKEQQTAKYGIIKRKELDVLFEGFEGDHSSDEEMMPKQVIVEELKEIGEEVKPILNE